VGPRVVIAVSAGRDGRRPHLQQRLCTGMGVAQSRAVGLASLSRPRAPELKPALGRGRGWRLEPDASESERLRP